MKQFLFILTLVLTLSTFSLNGQVAASSQDDGGSEYKELPSVH